MHRKDRISGTGGGLIAYINTNINCTRLFNFERSNIEIIVFEIALRNACPIIVIGVYRPPSTTVSVDKEIESIIESVYLDNKEVIILGDFNVDLFA